ncbi:hypothetical protein Celaphus_00013893 [Cervus elaphus hippelaphus]|uniref:Uncharacterized protein n=1 Tax=Cervus elaphus hippelaphus TaxID=46360 RepID=A0A212CCC3_CEREH|nr:hypothetical protein Celaphus_00013893 [Cervus elaphus hippelaphus]
MSSREPPSLAGPPAAYNLGLWLSLGTCSMSSWPLCSWLTTATSASQSSLYYGRSLSRSPSCMSTTMAPCSSTAFFVGMLSSLVHVFMHLYYGLASLGPCLRPLRGGSCTLLSCSWVNLWPLPPTPPTISLLSAPSPTGSTWPSSCTCSAS